MSKVQAKLKNCIENQSLKSLDRLSEALDTSTAEDDNLTGSQMETEEQLLASPAIDASETTRMAKGENKVMVSKRSKRKQKHSYRMKGMEAKKRAAESAEKPKAKPRFHCAF